MDWKKAARIAAGAIYIGVAVSQRLNKNGSPRARRTAPQQQPGQGPKGTIWDDDYVRAVVRAGERDRTPIPTEPPAPRFLGISADGVRLYTGDAARLGGRNGAKVFLVSGAGQGRARYVELDNHGTVGFSRSNDAYVSSLYSDPDSDS